MCRCPGPCIFFFFFSSRRRHTRCLSDWSSDVCSSDMTCPGCQAALPADAAFCGHCGRALQSERTCPRCGRPNAAEMHFCLGCGSPLAASGAAHQPDPRTYTPKHLAKKILTSRAALEGERKQVTVLFADVKGSMD